jgi:signal transduction histidine kinase
MYTEETKVYAAILIIAGILAVIIIFFLITLIRYQKRSIRLHKEKIIAEITTLENERKRVSADLHDGLGPVLSTVKFQIKSIDVHDSESKAMIHTAANHIDDMLTKIREIANDLRPTVLVRAGLVKAVQDFIDSIKVAAHISIESDFSNVEIALEKDKETHLYRIIQEVINNALKHANTKKMFVQLKNEKQNLILEVKDFGKGFNIQEVEQKSGGLGLRNIMSRVDVLNGNIYINSSTNNGTTYTIEIPNN